MLNALHINPQDNTVKKVTTLKIGPKMDKVNEKDLLIPNGIIEIEHQFVKEISASINIFYGQTASERI